MKMEIKYTIIGFVICLSFVAIIAIADALVNAKDIEFKPRDTDWNVKNVEAALNDIKDNYVPKGGSGNNNEWVYTYTGDYQVFDCRTSGRYKIQLWGSQGGYYTIISKVGYGGYTSGEINLTKGQKLYVYVGGLSDRSKEEAFNGGGGGGYGAELGYPGGGATDVRVFTSDIEITEDILKWDSDIGLKSRIMVAAGGSGYTDYSSGGELGHAGGLSGYSGSYYSGHGNRIQYGGGGTQTSGGFNGNNIYGATGTNTEARFGHGSTANNTADSWGVPGGGGGWFGGGAGGATGGNGMGNGSGGGSSYISGHLGCIGVDKNGNLLASTATKIEDSYSNTGFIFENTEMIDGKGCIWNSSVTNQCDRMPNHTNQGYMSGNRGNGYAKITLINVTE